MSTDFRPTRIATLATTDNALAGIRAIRNAAALTYNLARLSLSRAARGANFQVVDGTFTSARTDRENLVRTRYVGDSTDGSDGTAAYNIASLSLKSSYQGRQGTDSDDAAGVALRTYASGYALASGETYKVKVGGVLKTVTTDYTVSGANIIFVYTKAPAHMGPGFEIFASSSVTPVVGEVVTVSVNETIKTLTTHYTITDGVVTFEATFVPLAGQRIAIWFRQSGTMAYFYAGSGVDAGSSQVTPSPKVYKDVGAGYVAVDAADFTYVAPDLPTTVGSITFDAGAQPVHGSLVQLRWQYDFDDTFVVPGAAETGDLAALEVWIDTTKKTATTHYVITGRTIVFEAAGMPAAAEVVKAIAVSQYQGIVPAGEVTFFDNQRLNTPHWDYIRAGSSTVVEVM